MTDIKLSLGVNEISNADYHADNEYLSSSDLKLILKDSEKFYQKKILGQYKSEQKNVFDEGSLVHAMILEPEVIEEEFAFYDGIRKAGAEFEEFKEKNKGKIIISKPQKIRCDNSFKAYKARSEAQQFIRGGEPEHTICGLLADIPIKVRTDYINIDKGYIADVKTSGFSVDRESFAHTVDMYQYDLSAALYSMVASQHYGRDFDFYFVAISKRDEVCEIFKMSDKRMQRGKDNVMKALNRYRECKRNNDWTNQLSRVKIKPANNYEILEV